MKTAAIRSLPELVRLAKERLDNGAPVGEAVAILHFEGDDVVCVRASRDARRPEGKVILSHLFNGHPIRPQALRLILLAHGATLRA